jgi:hypothetical protein
MMTITTTKLTRAAGLAAIVAGVLYILVQFIHPHEEPANVVTTGWVVTHFLTLLMALLAMIGISGMYLRQVKQTGLLGLAGFILFMGNFLLIFAWTFVEAAVLPLLVGQLPQFVNDFIWLPAGGAPVGDVGSLKAVTLVAAVLYLLGGLLFGIAMYRGGVLARWAALLLAAGAAVTVIAAVIPHSAARILAIPVGIAVAGLGYSLFREQHAPAAESVAAVNTPMDPAAAK